MRKTEPAPDAADAGPQPGLNRRELLASALALGAALPHRARAASPAAKPRPTAIVVGAGAFGGWSALSLVRRGFAVTLLDPWGAGHSRSSSGGETRVIRASYGERAVYTRLVARALELWRDFDDRRGTHLFHPVGVLWLHGADASFVRTSQEHVRAAGLAFEVLEAPAAAKRWPQIDWSGVARASWEPECGYLLARQAMHHVAQALREAGGTFLQAEARPELVDGRAAVRLASGEALAADHVVFACGPWLGRLFPDLLGTAIRPTRQEVHFFGTPPGDIRFDPPTLPVWADSSGERLFYGIPGVEQRGFKVADDTHGPSFDPTAGDRTPSADALARARAYVARRFPALAGAPLVEARVCQYENSPDGHLIFDRHPQAPNLWLLGGGSGHGFKLGPALGEHVAAAIAGEAPLEPTFALARLAAGKR